MTSLTDSDVMISVSKIGFYLAIPATFIGFYAGMAFWALLTHDGRFPPASFVVIGLVTLIFAGTGYYLGQIFDANKPKTREKISVNKAGLNSMELAITILVCLVAPIIGGALLYYYFRNKYPEKANQANRISFIIFGIELVGYFLTNNPLFSSSN